MHKSLPVCEKFHRQVKLDLPEFICNGMFMDIMEEPQKQGIGRMLPPFLRLSQMH
jgi:hypothetical protein